MSDYVQTLAQLMANSRQANNVNVQNPQAGQLNFATGSTNMAGGPIGENFGQGVGSYINDTVVKAEKNKYALENDPIEIEKRADKFYGVYHSLAPQEQDKVDKWLNETPDGLKWLDKLNKFAKYGMTKVPLPEGWTPKPGQAMDDVQIYRPLRPIQSQAQQQGAALGQMAPDARNKMMFAPQLKDQAEMAKTQQETQLMPRRVAVDESQAASQRMSAQASQASAAAHTRQAATAEKLAPSEIAYRLALAAAAGKKVDYGMIRQKMEEDKQQNLSIRAITKSVNDTLAGIAKSNMGMIDYPEKDFAYKVSGGDQAKGINPDSIEAAGLYDSAATTALAQYRHYASPKNLNEEKLSEWANNAEALLSKWQSSIGSRSEYMKFQNAYIELKRHYWEHFYPDIKAAKVDQDKKLQMVKARMTNEVQQMHRGLPELDRKELEDRKKRQFLSSMEQAAMTQGGGQ